jgi:FkbM family methyltransferase
LSQETSTLIKTLAKSLYRVIPFKQKVFSLMRSLPVPERLYRHLHFRGAFGVRIPGGGEYTMMHHGHQLENDLFWAGYGNNWERTSLRLWVWLARDAKCIFDVGANTGTYALAARAVNDKAEVQAFEPVDRVYSKLQINSSLNGNQIGTNNIALSNRAGPAELFDDGKDHVYSASLNAKMLGTEGNRARCVVSVITLDAYVEAHGLIEPDLLKIDVEMHEPEVIEGALGVISRARPAILIELLNAELSARVVSLLSTYVFYEIVEGGGLHRCDRFDDRADRNFLLLPEGDPRVDVIGNWLDETAFSRLAER